MWRRSRSRTSWPVCCGFLVDSCGGSSCGREYSTTTWGDEADEGRALLGGEALSGPAGAEAPDACRRVSARRITPEILSVSSNTPSPGLPTGAVAALASRKLEPGPVAVAALASKRLEAFFADEKCWRAIAREVLHSARRGYNRGSAKRAASATTCGDWEDRAEASGWLREVAITVASRWPSAASSPAPSRDQPGGRSGGRCSVRTVGQWLSGFDDDSAVPSEACILSVPPPSRQGLRHNAPPPPSRRPPRAPTSEEAPSGMPLTEATAEDSPCEESCCGRLRDEMPAGGSILRVKHRALPAPPSCSSKALPPRAPSGDDAADAAEMLLARVIDPFGEDEDDLFSTVSKGSAYSGFTTGRSGGSGSLLARCPSSGAGPASRLLPSARARSAPTSRKASSISPVAGCKSEAQLPVGSCMAETSAAMGNPLTAF